MTGRAEDAGAALRETDTGLDQTVILEEGFEDEALDDAFDEDLDDLGAAPPAPDSAALERSAMEERSADAMYRLGLIYSTGQGVPVDIVTAHKWFNLAAQLGSEPAKSCRKELSAEMSQDEIAEAQRQARAWISAA